MTEHDKDLITGALDSLGVALAEHQHQWTDGERAIYEESIKTLWNMAESYRQLQQQLDAEREKYERASKEQKELIDCVEQTWNVLEKDSGAKAWPWGLLAVAKTIRAQVDRLLQVRGVHPTVQQLREQLAAEREHSSTIAKLADDQMDSFNATCDQLREQLDAEREKVQMLVEVLKEVVTDATDIAPLDMTRAKAMLAKI